MSTAETGPHFVRIAGWCRMTGMSRTATYEALGRQQLRAIKHGRSVLIDVAHGLSWLNSLPAASIRAPKKAA
jgi:hypothetical protein